MRGEIEAAVPLPDGVLAAVTSGSEPREPAAPKNLHPLVITACQHVVQGFSTDRGRQDLPAWSLDVTHSIGPVLVLDPEAAHPWFRSGLDPRRTTNESAQVAADDVTVRLRFSPEDWLVCRGGDVVESDTAVVIVPNLEASGEDPWGEARARMPTSPRRSRVPLARVLVSLVGWPVAVTPLPGS